MNHSLEQLKTVITDPNKLKQIQRLPDEILGLIVQSYISESDFDQLRKYEEAYKARGLYRMKVVDYGSPQSREWKRLESRYTKHRAFVPFAELEQRDDVLLQAKIELALDHPHHVGDHGIKVIGALPKAKNKVELLISHNQYRWLPSEYGHGIYDLMEFESDQYNIPSVITVGELKRWSTQQGIATLYEFMVESRGEKVAQPVQLPASEFNYFFTMPPLDQRSNYWDVTFN